MNLCFPLSREIFLRDRPDIIGRYFFANRTAPLYRTNSHRHQKTGALYLTIADFITAERALHSINGTVFRNNASDIAMLKSFP